MRDGPSRGPATVTARTGKRRRSEQGILGKRQQSVREIGRQRSSGPRSEDEEKLIRRVVVIGHPREFRAAKPQGGFLCRTLVLSSEK